MEKLNNGNKLPRLKLIAASGVILFAVANPALAAEPTGGSIAITRSASDAKLSSIVISVNKSRTQRISFPFSDVIIGQPDVAEVIPITDQQLYILGKKIGTTNVSLYNAEKHLVGVIDLRVNQETIEGFAPDAAVVERSVSVQPTTTVNNTKVAAPQQVMLKVRFAEVQRGAARQLGVRYDFNEGQINPPVRVSVGGDRVSQTRLTGSPYARAQFGVGNIDVTLEALEGKSLARRLAEPNLVAISGETASFIAGGEFPIPVTNADGVGVIFKPYGVTLQFTPTVLEQGRIHLRVKPSVSEFAGYTPTGFPSFTTRGADTSVELRDGQSFALAGLLQNQSSRNSEQLPWLGSVPVIGALFRSQEFQNNETELVVIVTPHLVKPSKPGQPLRIPQDNTVPGNDVDQFLVGDLEVKKRPLENGVKIDGKTTQQFGHILKPRPPVIKVPVAGQAPAVPAPVAPQGVAVSGQPVTLRKSLPAVAAQ